MLMGRLFSRSKGMDFFLDRRGSRVTWVIAAVCVVVVFLGTAFVLLSGKTPDKKRQTVPAVFQREIREPLKRYAVSNPVAIKSEKPEAESGAPLEVALQETSGQGVEDPSNEGFSQMRNVLPDDPPGRGSLLQSPDEPAPPVLSETREVPQTSLSSSAGKPPLVAENFQPTDKALRPGNDKPALSSPSEVSDLSEASRARPSEGLAGAKSGSNAQGWEKLTVIVEVGNVREGPSVKEKVVFTVARGDTVQVADQKGNWCAVLMDDGRSGWVHRSLLYVPRPSSSKESSKASSVGTEKVIQGIRTVVTDPDHAQIVFELNGYYPPEIVVIEGESPRVVCDFFGVRLAPGVGKKLPVTTGVVKRIRVGIHKGQKPKTRVVLDLEGGQNYAVEQFFFEKENYYAIMVNAGE